MQLSNARGVCVRTSMIEREPSAWPFSMSSGRRRMREAVRLSSFVTSIIGPVQVGSTRWCLVRCAYVCVAWGGRTVKARLARDGGCMWRACADARARAGARAIWRRELKVALLALLALAVVEHLRGVLGALDHPHVVLAGESLLAPRDLYNEGVQVATKCKLFRTQATKRR